MKKIKIFFFLIMLFLTNRLWAATPEVFSVSENPIDGQTLTISGSNMVDHNTANWNMNGTDWNFEGAGYIVDGYDVPTEDNMGLCAEPAYAGISYDSSVKLMGAKSIRFHQQGAFSGPGVGGCYVYATPSPVVGDDIYVSGYVRYDSSAGGDEWPDNYLKLFLALGGPTENLLYFQPDSRLDGGGPASRFLMYENNTSTYGDIPGGPIKNNRWYYIEAYYKNSSPKRYQAWIDGVQIGDWVPTGNINSPWYFDLGMINMSETSPTFDMKLNIDRFVVASSRIYPASTIEIGNHPNYEEGVIRYQEPVFLSDNSIQIKVNLEGLGEGPYYLWITNNKQERSAYYFLGTEDNYPNAPTGLNIL
ncbi:MAG: hypothetical protein V3574_04145 [Candidatus Moraniibacteriota bacterium]